MEENRTSKAGSSAFCGKLDDNKAFPVKLKFPKKVQFFWNTLTDCKLLTPNASTPPYDVSVIFSHARLSQKNNKVNIWIQSVHNKI